MPTDNHARMCNLVHRWMRETLEADNPKDAADALRYLRNAINSPHQPLTGDIRWQHLADIATWATIAAALTKQETEQ